MGQVADFGFACVVASSAASARASHKGTALYLAPEQVAHPQHTLRLAPYLAT